jgi:hypothetical protein
VSSFEVEARVHEHPAVSESAAVAVPSELGEDDVFVLVCLHEGESLKAEELVAFLERRARGFMIPRYVEFVDTLPRTDATQRVRKTELRSRGVGPPHLGPGSPVAQAPDAPRWACLRGPRRNSAVPARPAGRRGYLITIAFGVEPTPPITFNGALVNMKL